MKLIVDIPYEAYYTFKCDLGKGNLNALAEIVANGTPYEERQQGEWIPVTTRPMTEEEEKDACERLGVDHLEDYEKRMFTCQLPEDEQEILISTHWGVSLDTCDIDPDYGYGLENNGDWDGVLAWMPLPEPYKVGGEQNEDSQL